MEDEVWIAKDGRKIPVSELTEEHAKNIIRMLIRKAKSETEFIENWLYSPWDTD